MKEATIREITWDDTDECIEWPHARSRSGYGQTYRNGRVVYVHRVVWEMVNGRAPKPGEEVRHSCDNPPCFNPRHLLIGSRADNMRDAAERKRMHHYRAIPPALLKQWIERYAAGEFASVLAAESGYTTNAVSRAIRRVRPDLTKARHGKDRWRHRARQEGSGAEHP